MADTPTQEPLYYTKHLSPSEQAIVLRLVEVILATGYCITVYDGEEFVLRRCAIRDTVLNNIGATDEDILVIRSPSTGERIGHVYLVYGNEPGVVICDHTDSVTMNALLEPVFAYARTFEQ